MALILIADDDEIVVEVARAALEAAGHIVGAVDDGMPVIPILNYKHPDLVILDWNMPELSGLETLRKIRLSPISYATPVLMLTATCGQADEDIALRVGANDYLRKPFDPDELVARVEALLLKAEARKHIGVSRPAYQPMRASNHAWGKR